MIENYFDNVSNNEKKDLACEIIIELGDKEYWDTKDEIFKNKMSEVYKKQIDNLEFLVPNFKVASAIIHYDETSPHIHIVGVPIKCKNKKVEIEIFMYLICITILKWKKIEKNTENLKQANKKSLELKQNSKNIKEKIDKLKIFKINKDNYVLSKEDNDSFIHFIDQVDNTNKEYDKIQILSNTLVNVHEQLKDKNNKIKTLSENNEISFLKSKIDDFKNAFEYWKNRFEKLIFFLYSKLHRWYDKDDKYIDVINDMYENNVLDNDDIDELDLSKERDDYEK